MYKQFLNGFLSPEKFTFSRYSVSHYQGRYGNREAKVEKIEFKLFPVPNYFQNLNC